LHKAIKFVASDSEDGRGGERFGQELAAFEQSKPFATRFCSRSNAVEQIDGRTHHGHWSWPTGNSKTASANAAQGGLPGIPRDELLAYFADAAEAPRRDLGQVRPATPRYQPANLFLVSGHVKVGDYGLVAQLEGPDAATAG